MNYRCGWLTLNRACNLRCKWCYARKTGFKVKDDLDINLAYGLIDIFKDFGIKHICLLGGEPTLYKYLDDVIKYINNNNMKATLVTNGISLSNEEFLNNIIDSGISNINISLKGECKEKYKEITGFDCYNKVMKAINNCAQRKIKFGVSMVLTEDNINSYTLGLEDAYKAGARNFNLSFCYEFNMNKEYSNYLSKMNPRNIIKGFIKSYDKLDKVTHHRFKLFQTYPLCLWDKDFIQMLDSKNQVSSVCQLQSKTGLLFDNFGNIIPCNAMYEVKLGKYGVDFTDSNSLKQYIRNDKIRKMYKRFCGLPSTKCINCKMVLYCGGGCVCQWTNYSYNDLMKREK